jgi:hypothetical protein
MISNERAEQILKDFNFEPGDMINGLGRPLRDEELELLLKHSDATVEQKEKVQKELARRRAKREDSETDPSSGT